jgi:hypothetical protein
VAKLLLLYLVLMALAAFLVSRVVKDVWDIVMLAITTVLVTPWLVYPISLIPPTWSTGAPVRLLPHIDPLGESFIHLAAILILLGTILSAIVIWIGKWIYGRNEKIDH